MFHDIGIFLCNAPSVFCFGNHNYIEHGYFGAQILVNEGFERHRWRGRSVCALREE